MSAQARRRAPPSIKAVDRQVRLLCSDPALRRKERAKELLKFLVQAKVDRRFESETPPTGAMILWQFYHPGTQSHTPSEFEQTQAKGKKLIGSLFRALEEYYDDPNLGLKDLVVISIPRGKGSAYEPKIRWRSERSTDAEESTAGSSIPKLKIISGAKLISEIETRTPAGGEIWVATPDLSNVGDETSLFAKLVRRVVRQNAKRNITYCYIFPEQGPGNARLVHLKSCFPAALGKRLRLYARPEKTFRELGVVPFHFISHNPNEPIPDAYMQLPLPGPEKSWIKLDRDLAAIVIREMKRLMTESERDASAPGNFDFQGSWKYTVFAPDGNFSHSGDCEIVFENHQMKMRGVRRFVAGKRSKQRLAVLRTWHTEWCQVCDDGAIRFTYHIDLPTSNKAQRVLKVMCQVVPTNDHMDGDYNALPPFEEDIAGATTGRIVFLRVKHRNRAGRLGKRKTKAASA
jgi:hypothetical protein